MNTRSLMDKLLQSGQQFLDKQNTSSNTSDNKIGQFLTGAGGGALAGTAVGLLLGNKKARKMGGSVLKYGGVAALGAVAFKLIAAPILVLFLAQFWTLDKVDIGVLFFMASAPTTSASYVMAQAMGGNGKLAAHIVVISTMGSIFTVSFGLAFIKLMGIV